MATPGHPGTCHSFDFAPWGGWWTGGFHRDGLLRTLASPETKGRANTVTTKYVVGSERERWVDLPRIRTGWHVGNGDQHAPDGRRHAVDLDTAHTACGLPAQLLVVFEELDWATMLSNDMSRGLQALCPVTKDRS